MTIFLGAVLENIQKQNCKITCTEQATEMAAKKCVFNNFWKRIAHYHNNGFEEVYRVNCLSV